MYIDSGYTDSVKNLLALIREIRTDTGYSTDQVLMAMLIVAIDRK